MPGPIVALGLLLSTSTAAAPPDDPAGTAGQAAATSGATELEGQGKFATAADPTAPPADPAAPPSTDATEFTVSAGAIVSTGNAEAAAVTTATNLRIRRQIHQFGAVGAGNWGAARADEDEWHDTVGNAQGRVRYDVFFAKQWSAFTMVTARHDPFQGLDMRLNVDPGVAYYALPGPANKLWFEAGYDFQFDLRTDDAIVAKDANGQPILDSSGSTIEIANKTATNHAVRVFAGYSNRMAKSVTFDAGFEFLQSVIVAKRFRFVGDVALTVQLRERLSIATTFTIRYENQPLPDIKKLDTITAINLLYRFL